MMVEFVSGDGDIADARALFIEYQHSLKVDLVGTQNIDEEIALLPGQYVPPLGALLLGRDTGGATIGCAAVRPLERPSCCELKRLYVRPLARGSGTGRLLMKAAIGFAAKVGYREMLLDSLPTMQEAIGLYRSLGFNEVPPYWHNPLPGARYFGRALDATA